MKKIIVAAALFVTLAGVCQAQKPDRAYSDKWKDCMLVGVGLLNTHYMDDFDSMARYTKDYLFEQNVVDEVVWTFDNIVGGWDGQWPAVYVLDPEAFSEFGQDYIYDYDNNYAIISTSHDPSYAYDFIETWYQTHQGHTIYLPVVGR